MSVNYNILNKIAEKNEVKDIKYYRLTKMTFEKGRTCYCKQCRLCKKIILYHTDESKFYDMIEQYICKKYSLSSLKTMHSCLDIYSTNEQIFGNFIIREFVNKGKLKPICTTKYQHIYYLDIITIKIGEFL